MRMFLPMNCESQKVACSLSIFVLALRSLLGGDCMYGRYQLYLFADMTTVRSLALSGVGGVALRWLSRFREWLDSLVSQIMRLACSIGHLVPHNKGRQRT